MPDSENDSDKKRQFTLLKTAQFALEFGFIIALPLFAGVWAGQRLDTAYGERYFTPIGILLALTATTVWLTRRIKEILKDLKD